MAIETHDEINTEPGCFLIFDDVEGVKHGGCVVAVDEKAKTLTLQVLAATVEVKYGVEVKA